MDQPEIAPAYSDAPIVTLLFLTVGEDAQQELPAVYHTLTADLLQQQPELALSLLARRTEAQSSEQYVIFSQWDRQAAYQQWESNEQHRAALRPLTRIVQKLRPERFVCVG